MPMNAAHKRNWMKAKFSGKPFQAASVPVNSRSIPAHLGTYADKSKMPPRLSK